MTRLVPVILCAVVSIAAGPAYGDPAAARLAPARYREAVEAQLAAAGANRGELLAALQAVPESRREALAFLLANMPQRDLESLTKDFLLHQVDYAYRARARTPWGATLPDEVFFNGVLPYASVNERRDDWRQDFFQRFLSAVQKCRTPGEAAVKYASCTGLSVLLVDACRAVAVPARVVGTPLWSDMSGNHTWAEVWDGQWHFLGSAESTRLDDAWFAARAAKADPSMPEHRIYATSFQRTGLSFPLVWDPSIHYVPAEDVTASYTNRRAVTIRILTR